MLLIQGAYEKTIAYCDEKYGDDYFEFEFTYTPLEDSFKEINRFIWESKHLKTRYKNKYSGRVVIDISSWCKRSPNEYFDAFMYYLKGNSDSYRVDFISDTECSEQLLGKLKRFFEIESINLGINKSTVTKKIGFYPEPEEYENV